MKSFIEYRKNKLLKGKKLNIQESIVECFDLLRLDLLNSIKLPDIISESTRVKAITESAYEVCKKEDYQDNKQIIELIISEFKNNFWSHLISEATATAEKEPGVTADDLKKQMSDDIDSMVGELKQLVSRSLSVSRTTTGSDTEDADTSSNEPGEENSPTPKLTANQAKYISDLYQKLGRNPPSEVEKLSPLQASRLIDQLKQKIGTGTRPSPSAPTSFQFNTNQSSGSSATGDDEDLSLDQPSSSTANSFPNSNQQQVANGRYVLPNDWKSKYGTRYGTERPSYPDGFKPAPYGHMKPSDGWLGGLKRTIWDPATGWLKNKTRNFRRRWHRDEFREHFINLENIFLENAVEVMSDIDTWTTRLKDIVLNKYFDQIKDFLSGDVQSLPKTKDSVAGKTGDVSPRKQSPAVDAGSVEGDDDDDVEYEDDKDVEDEDSSSVEDNDGAEVQAQNSPQGTKIEAEAISLNNGFNLGAELLGIKIKPVGVEGGKQKLVPSSFLGEDEQPISESWAKVRNYVIEKLLAKMLEDTNEPERSKTIFRRKAVGFSIKYAAVKEWLDIETSGTVEAIKDLLFNYYRKVQREKGRNIVLKTRNNRTTSKVDRSQVRDDSAKAQDLTPEQKQNIKEYKEFKENNKELFAKFIEYLKNLPPNTPLPKSEEELEKALNKEPVVVWSWIKKWIHSNSGEGSQGSGEGSQGSGEGSQGSGEGSQELKKKSIADEQFIENLQEKWSDGDVKTLDLHDVLTSEFIEDGKGPLTLDDLKNSIKEFNLETEEGIEDARQAVMDAIKKHPTTLARKKLNQDQLKSSKKSAAVDATPASKNPNKSVDKEEQIEDELKENKKYLEIKKKYKSYLKSKGLEGESLIDGLKQFDKKIIKDILSKGKDKIEDILSTQENLLDNLIEKIKEEPEPENLDVPEGLHPSFEKLERDTQHKALIKHYGDSLRKQGKDEETIKKELHEKTLKHAREMLDQEKTIKQIVQDYEKELGIVPGESSDESKSSQSSNSEEEIRRIARSSGEIERISKSGKPIALKTVKKEIDETIKEIIDEVRSQGGELVLKDGKIKVKYQEKDGKGRVLKTIVQSTDSLSDKIKRRIKKHKDEIIEFLKPDEDGPVEDKTSDKQKEEPNQTLEEIPERLKNIDGYNSLRQEIVKIINDSNNQVMRNILVRKESEWLDSDLSDEQIKINLQELKNRFNQQTNKTEGFLGILKRFKELINS